MIVCSSQDELITLPAPTLPDPADREVEPVNEGDLHVEDLTEGPQTSVPVEVVPLKPPSAIFRPIDYPALHIFVSGLPYIKICLFQ